MGIADLALGAAPIAGGALMGLAAGSIKGPDFRGMIKTDLDLLDKIPPEDVELRAEFKASIDRRIKDLIASTEKTRELRDVAASYKGNWRDIVVFVCAVLFTIVWWNVAAQPDQLAADVRLPDPAVGRRLVLRLPRRGPAVRHMRKHDHEDDSRG